MEDILYKALENIALGYSEGNVSVDVLIKACDVYKQKTEFIDDFDYQIKVAKSCFDDINGVKPNVEISKAILPGQTKVVDGIMYIYTATKVGSKTEYGWHVVRKGSKTGKDIGRGSKIKDDKIIDKQKFINSLFPKDLSSLVPGDKSIGGSTGAQLMKDVNGDLYVMKRGKNTNNGHVKSEYLANQLYDILGLRVPDYELYDDNGEAVILSKFIPLCQPPQLKDYREMAQGFIADCVLANWDVYQNDNCLIDPSGHIIRVDNGGALNYKARGGNKKFDDNIEDTFKSMAQYNQSVYSQLSDNDIRNQIVQIRDKRDDIVNFLKEDGQDVLADIIKKRIDGLSKIEAMLNVNRELEEIPILPRQLKSDKEMYRELSDDELDKIWKEISPATDGYRKLFQTNENGWELLSKICNLRGFDARPQVVSENEYWDLVKKDPSRQFFRGVSTDITRRRSLSELSYSMLFDDNCYYGATGVYGQGIYAHRNNGRNSDSTEDTYKNSEAWGNARSYAQMNQKGFIYKGILSPEAKIVKYDDLENEINSRVTELSKETKEAQNEIINIDTKLSDLDTKIENISQNSIADVYNKMHYDSLAYANMNTEIENVDWGKKNAFGEREIPSFEDFVIKKMGEWVKEQGGDFKIRRGVVNFTLPDSESELSISSYQYDGPYSIKQKNPFTPAYNYAVEKFVDWMTREKLLKVQEAVQSESTKKNDKIKELESQKDRLIKIRDEQKEKVQNAIKNLSGDEGIKQAILKHKDCAEVLGIYGALKGYDAIEVTMGGGHNSFYIVLNRSKLIMSNKIDNV